VIYVKSCTIIEIGEIKFARRFDFGITYIENIHADFINIVRHFLAIKGVSHFCRLSFLAWPVPLKTSFLLSLPSLFPVTHEDGDLVKAEETDQRSRI
jgi:hypothetical protein